MALLPLLPLLALAAPGLSLRARVDGRPQAGTHVYARVGQAVELEAAGPAAGPALRWFKLEPVSPSVDNTQPRFHWATIQYRETELEACRGQARCAVDVRPTVFPEVAAARGAGTMAFQARAALPDGGVAATPGLESVERGGLSRAVFKVTFRRDDTYLGYLTELLYTPYIFGSAGPDGANQTDDLVGSDCADLVVYGRRRQGLRAEYTSSYALDRQAREVARAVALGADGVAQRADGGTLAVGAAGLQPGDVLHFPGSRHVAVLWEDRPPLGVLDASDLMIHTCWAPPAVEPVGQSSCASLPWRILRFPPQPQARR